MSCVPDHVCVSRGLQVRHNNLALYRRLRQLLMDESRVFIFFANEHHCEVQLIIIIVWSASVVGLLLNE
jgi:hypothetical protein